MCKLNDAFAHSPGKRAAARGGGPSCPRWRQAAGRGGAPPRRPAPRMRALHRARLGTGPAPPARRDKGQVDRGGLQIAQMSRLARRRRDALLLPVRRTASPPAEPAGKSDRLMTTQKAASCRLQGRLSDQLPARCRCVSNCIHPLCFKQTGTCGRGVSWRWGAGGRGGAHVDDSVDEVLKLVAHKPAQEIAK